MASASRPALLEERHDGLRAKERETGDMLDNLRAENENLRQHVLQARARAIRRRNSTAQFGARRNSL